MPFGKKTDLASGTEIDFDQIYQTGIKPAIEDAGLEALRGDEERTGGIIHSAMFARLLLAEFVVADLTLANPNVFYELGIRHAAKPFTTVPIFANVRALPFDVGLVRAIPYELEKGQMMEEPAKKLRAELTRRLKEAAKATTPDSPLVSVAAEVSGHRSAARRHGCVSGPGAARGTVSRTSSTRRATGRPTRSGAPHWCRFRPSSRISSVVQRSILVDLLLSYRAVEAWPEVVALCEAMPQHLKDAIVVRQQWAFALNRRNQPGDRDKAVRVLEELVKQRGPDPETLGILGRVHKDRYRDAKSRPRASSPRRRCDDAIDAYTRGFEADPRDYYPGVNAITLADGEGIGRTP